MIRSLARAPVTFRVALRLFLSAAGICALAAAWLVGVMTLIAWCAGVPDIRVWWSL